MSKNRLWDEHIERLSGIHDSNRKAAARPTGPRRAPTDREAADALQAEWTARPPGRLGRLVLADVERYLEFFAIARS